MIYLPDSWPPINPTHCQPDYLSNKQFGSGDSSIQNFSMAPSHLQDWTGHLVGHLWLSQQSTCISAYHLLHILHVPTVLSYYCVFLHASFCLACLPFTCLPEKHLLVLWILAQKLLPWGFSCPPGCHLNPIGSTMAFSHGIIIFC